MTMLRKTLWIIAIQLVMAICLALGCDICLCDSPIIVDTTGAGFQLTSVADGVLFDIQGNGAPEKIAWTAEGSKDAFLVLDRNHNGRIDNGSELFGNFSPQPPSDHPNGFLALALFDRVDGGGNGDGVVDQRDSVFSDLRLWIDANHDGVSQENELYTLPQLGVTSIGLHYIESPRIDDFGNEFRYKARVNGREPNEHSVGLWAYDVFLTALGQAAVKRKE